MFVIAYRERSGIWGIAEAVVVNVENPSESTKEPLFFNSVDEAISFAVEEFDNYRFEILRMCAIGEVKNNELVELHDRKGSNILEKYK